MPNLGVCQNPVAKNINSNSKRGFQDTKTCRKPNFKAVWAELELKMCILR